MFKATPILLIVLSFLISCDNNNDQASQEETVDYDHEILLIGTFHYNNPGQDVAKTKSFDILSEESQNQLNELAMSIGEFKPTKVFVEWPFDEQTELDSLFDLYRKGVYFNDSLSDFYRKNEIFQLAFRVAENTKIERVHGVDYNDTDFPFDSLMSVVATEGQKELETEIMQSISNFTEGFDNQIVKGSSVTELTNYLNTEEFRRMSNTFHCEIPLLVGDESNHIGPYLSSEWIKRNLYMWSLLQKATSENDERVVVLLGASHIATIKTFIDQNSKWKTLELTDL